MALHLARVLSAVLLLHACGGGDASGEGAADAFPDHVSCGVALRASGALELHIPPSDTSTACVTPVHFDSGIRVTFLLVESELQHAELEIEGVLEGEIGGGFPATLTFEHGDGRTFSASCTAELDMHEYVGPAEEVGPAELGWKQYLVAGSLRCEPAESASPDGGLGLELESFTFVATVTWG